MSMELVRRAKALRLCKDILGDEVREKDLADLISSIEQQDSLIEGLLRHEEALKLSLNQQSNLIPLVARSKEFAHQKKHLRIFEKRFVVDTPCLIEGATAEERKKLAFEIHSRSSKSVFVENTSLDKEASWSGLGDSTLYIPKIEELTQDQQTKLSRLFNEPERPLILSGTFSTYAQLKEDLHLPEKLLSQVSQAHFRLQKPLKEYLELGFFKLFLESLT